MCPPPPMDSSLCVVPRLWNSISHSWSSVQSYLPSLQLSIVSSWITWNQSWQSSSSGYKCECNSTCAHYFLKLPFHRVISHHLTLRPQEVRHKNVFMIFEFLRDVVKKVCPFLFIKHLSFAGSFIRTSINNSFTFLTCHHLLSVWHWKGMGTSAHAQCYWVECVNNALPLCINLW